MPKRLHTGVSKAYWCTRSGDFHEAKIEPVTQINGIPEEVSWLDRLFEGGIVLPDLGDDEKRALTILLTGPPGSGKSTLALELCHRWGLTTMIEKSGKPTEITLPSLYITSESSEAWAIQKANSFGWKGKGKSLSNKKHRDTAFPSTVIWETNEFQEFLQDKKGFYGLIEALAEFFSPIVKPSPLVKFIQDRWSDASLKKGIQKERPDVLVIDSLNTIDVAQQSVMFSKFMQLVNVGPRIIVIILESDSSERTAEFWEYVADIVIRADRSYVSEYLVRTLEIVKARYQSHVWGNHKLKIYPSTDIETLTVEQRKRSHPYREEGGVFIYPSIHYYLSIYKKYKLDSNNSEYVDTPINSLNNVLQGGFPKGKCTGFIGVRGGHKSHLAYHCILSKIVNPDADTRALIISLRDDEVVARRTLRKIIQQDTRLNASLDQLEQDDRLELLYYPPGYVAPEEFFHKMFMSIHRLKHSGSRKCELIVLFNSLDQLSSRFPLCARQQIFIPGIIESLSAENISSFFIAVEEKGQPPEQYGLLSMADALISFDREVLTRNDYLGHIEEHASRSQRAVEKEDIIPRLPEIQQTVTLRVVRYAGGQAAGAGGFLELVEKSSAIFDVFKEEGLHFIPFSPLYNKSTSAGS